jgi:hypothetical protein
MATGIMVTAAITAITVTMVTMVTVAACIFR